MHGKRPRSIFRQAVENGSPWFVAKDICDVLGTRTDDVTKLLDADEMTKMDPDTIGVRVNAPHGIRLISESGMYSLVLRSRKPEARRFKKCGGQAH